MLALILSGMDDEDDSVKPRPLKEMLHDTTRVAYYEGYLSSVLQAIRCFAGLTQTICRSRSDLKTVIQIVLWYISVGRATLFCKLRLSGIINALTNKKCLVCEGMVQMSGVTLRGHCWTTSSGISATQVVSDWYT